MTDFGDLEDADVWDAEPTIAPEQVTYRLHALRVEVDRLAGRDPDTWEHLTDDEQALALAIGDVTVAWIAARAGALNPALLAEQLHTVRVWLARGLMPAWDELAPDERQVGIDVMDLVVTWLEREGPR